jgi:hypothetical protein
MSKLFSILKFVFNVLVIVGFIFLVLRLVGINI